MIKMLQKHEILKDLIKIFSKIVLKDKNKYDEKNNQRIVVIIEQKVELAQNMQNLMRV